MTDFISNDNMNDVIKFLSSINEKRTRIYEITSSNPSFAKTITNLYATIKKKNTARLKMEEKTEKAIYYFNKFKKDPLFLKSLKAKLPEGNREIYFPKTVVGGTGDDTKELQFDKLINEIKNALKKRQTEKLEEGFKGGDDSLNEIKNYNKLLTTGTTGTSQQVTYNDVKGTLYDLENDNKIMAFKYNQEDKYIFIAVTFVLRIITLIFIKWAIDVDFVNIFESALYLYIALYIIFVGILWGLVNFDGIEKTPFALLKYYLYSFNKQINNGIHLIIHLILLIILSFIPFIIQAGKDDLSFNKYNLASIEAKRDMYRSISTFSLLIWIVLSMIALV